MMIKYTKGDKNIVVSRIEQVSVITLYVPSSDSDVQTSERCIDYLYDGLITLSNHYIDDNNGDSFLHVPAIDFYNIALFADKCCKEKEIDTKYILSIIGVMKTFTNLKYVSVVFKDDDVLRDTYEKLTAVENEKSITHDVINDLVNIYTIDVLDIYLSDLFEQTIIDLINKSFISNGIISNLYLERDFLVRFKFDEYISYINMFINNNIDMLSMLDGDIIDYLRVFPTIVGDITKPDIKLYTNYVEV